MARPKQHRDPRRPLIEAIAEVCGWLILIALATQGIIELFDWLFAN